MTVGAASVDSVVYRPDGTVCMHEVDDVPGLVQFEDTSGQVLGSVHTSQYGNSYSCGGYTTPHISYCMDDGGINIVPLNSCQNAPGPCP